MAERKRTPASRLSFSEAVQEVEEILRRLEDDAVDIDVLGAEVRRAVELIQVCRDKLARTDAEVRDLVSGLQVAAAEAKTEENAGPGGRAAGKGAAGGPGGKEPV